MSTSTTIQPETQHIGKIVKSNGHVDYVCQIDSTGEVSVPPEPHSYAFGTFVSIALESNGGVVSRGSGELIGVIYNTLLMNPDFGTMGPRLSPTAELEIFTPDYLAETATLVGIITLGWIDAAGAVHQGVPTLAGTVNNRVRRLDADELRRFHADADGSPRLRYVPLLLGQNNPLVPPLLLTVIDTLRDLFPDRCSQLDVMRNNVAWKSMIQPAG